MPPPSALGADRGSMNARTRKHATRACRVGGKGESQRPRADDTRMRAELARSAQQLAVPIEFVSVLDERRPEDVPRCAPGRHGHRAPVPGVAGVAGMSVRHPPADVVGQTDIAVVAAGRGGQIDGLPIDDRPRLRRPSAGHRRCGIASGRRAEWPRRAASADRPASALQVGDHDGPRQQGRQGDPDEQPALKEPRSVAPRYKKLALHYLALVHVSMIRFLVQWIERSLSPRAWPSQA